MQRAGEAGARALRAALHEGRAAQGGSRRTKAAVAAASAQAQPSEAVIAHWDKYAKLSRSEGAATHPLVNRRHRPQMAPSEVAFRPIDNVTGRMSSKHLKEEWTEGEIREAVQNNVMMTWGPNAPRLTIPNIVRGEGVHVYDDKGKEYIDMTSSAVCTNFGYSLPESVKQAMVKQMETLPYLYPGLGMTDVRARLCNLLAEVTPGDINGFLFPLGGAEANEGAIRIARNYTGRAKIMSAYRSYHGATSRTLAATGDFRTRFVESQNIVKMFNPQPHLWSTGKTDEETTKLMLQMLEEQMINEGPSTIAAVILESIVGANGVLVQPVGYMEGVRALCDKYGVLLICDEVMSGFWRTGPLFAFSHFRGVVPDILTSAKGLTGAFMPLSMIGVRQKIMDHFETSPLGWGSTYTNHPVTLAGAYELLRVNLQAGMEEKVAKVEAVMLDGVQGLIERHACVGQGRVIGAFGCLDLVGKDGKQLQELGAPMTAESLMVKKTMMERGLFGLFRSPLLHITPPLVISEPELKEMFSRLDDVLTELDRAIGAQ